MTTGYVQLGHQQLQVDQAVGQQEAIYIPSLGMQAQSAGIQFAAASTPTGQTVLVPISTGAPAQQVVRTSQGTHVIQTQGFSHGASIERVYKLESQRIYYFGSSVIWRFENQEKARFFFVLNYMKDLTN